MGTPLPQCKHYILQYIKTTSCLRTNTIHSYPLLIAEATFLEKKNETHLVKIVHENITVQGKQETCFHICSSTNQRLLTSILL